MPKPDKIDEYPPFVAEAFLPPGYPKLASRMEARPETAIFRRFGALRSRLLLCLQTELIDLELQYCGLERLNSKDSHAIYNRDYMSMIRGEISEQRSKEQKELLEKISHKLKEYGSASTKPVSVVKLMRPHR